MSKLKVVKELDLSGNKLSDVRLNTYLQKDDMELLNLSNNAIKYV
jgi:Leucine-rich repeat (LRR) protein